jgi:uncharacterized membrane protein YdjX (TVP38/TMEM64 family)
MAMMAAAAGSRPPWRLLGIFLALAIVVAVPFVLWGDQLERALHADQLESWFMSYRAFAWLVAVGLLVSDLLLPIPNTAVMAALGVLYGPLLGGLIATLGNCLSGLLGYGLCRRYGRGLAIRLAGEAELAASEALFARSGGWIVALSRWLPVLAEVVTCMAGLARMRFAAFGLALVSGGAPLGFTVAALGYLGSDRPLLTLVLCALLPVPLWLVARGLRRPDRS